MNKVITLVDSKYFKYGEFFLLTRQRVNAKFILYGPDLTAKQRKNLASRDIEYRQVDQELFNTHMQFLKFRFLRDEMDSGEEGAISFLDFDTFFVRDWHQIFNTPFDLGVTVRNDMIRNGLYRAYANGGVIFCRNTPKSAHLCDFAMKVMREGGHPDLPEYDKIFTTLEQNRPAHKTHYRTTMRWWVDQVFLSSLVMRYVTIKGKESKPRISDSEFFDYGSYRIGMFNCARYNKLDPTLRDVDRKAKNKKAYILHLKDYGRSQMQSLRKLFG